MTTKAFNNILLVLFVASVFAACSGSGSLSTNPADIQGDWELATLNGEELQVSGDNGAYTLSFNSDSTIAGRADCNYYTGKYMTAEEGSLNLQNISTTQIDCGGNSEYMSFVKSVMNSQSFQVEGGEQLVLSGGDGKVIFNRTALEEGEKAENNNMNN